MDLKKSLTTYLAGYIEADTKTAGDWRKEVSEALNYQSLLIYDPISREAQKTGKPAGEHVVYTTGLKKAGRWDLFKDEMRKIWFGGVKPGTNRYEVIKQFQFRSFIDGNQEVDASYWGDFEAVARSNFIIVYYKSGVQSWGTPGEAVLAFFLNIPIYVISDVAKSEINSSLLWWVLEADGEVFRSVNECVKFVKEKYKLEDKK